jgi:hypothetical protein
MAGGGLWQSGLARSPKQSQIWLEPAAIWRMPVLTFAHYRFGGSGAALYAGGALLRHFEEQCAATD